MKHASVLGLLTTGWLAGAPVSQPPAASQELHPSWSPDGTAIVFESNRYGNADLFIMELRSGQARRLTFATAEDSRPVWSPNGEWIAFHSNRTGDHDLYIVRPDGSGLTRLTTTEQDETNPAWNPASTALVFEAKRDDQWVLNHVEVSGQRRRSLFEGPGDHLTPSWITASRIGFSHSPPGGNHDTDLVLRVVDSSGNPQGVLLQGAAGNSNVHYSPANERLVFNSIRDGNWEIYSARIDGSDLRRLTTQPQSDLQGIDGQPAWSPDATGLAITSGRAGSLDIILMDPQGGEIRNLTEGWTTEADQDSR